MENTIIINNDIKEVYDIWDKSEINFIDINEKVNDIDLTFKAYNNLKINISSLTWNNDKKINVKINLEKENINVVLNINSITINGFKTNILLDGSNKINDEASIDMQINGIVHKEKSYINCIPMYHFSTNKIKANHGLVIGTFNDDDVYALLSKGIKPKDAKTMLIWSKFAISLNKLNDNELNYYYSFILNKWGANNE